MLRVSIFSIFHPLFSCSIRMKCAVGFLEFSLSKKGSYISYQALKFSRFFSSTLKSTFISQRSISSVFYSQVAMKIREVVHCTYFSCYKNRPGTNSERRQPGTLLGTLRPIIKAQHTHKRADERSRNKCYLLWTNHRIEVWHLFIGIWNSKHEK